MILTIDIGNTNTVIGGFRGDELVFTLRIRSDRNKTADEYALQLKGLLELRGVCREEIEGGIVSSVVPVLKNVIPRALRELTGQQFLVVGTGIKTGLNIRMDYPGQLGADLVVDAVAALNRYKAPLVIFDMGTATTLSVIDPKGDYIGGMIIPGLRLSLDALSANAAQLPFIHLEQPSHLIGTNTVDCMKSGMIDSNAAMIDGLIDRVEDELGQPVTAVATGGLMGLILPNCKRTIHYYEHLMLEGLYALYHKNQNRRKKSETI